MRSKSYWKDFIQYVNNNKYIIRKDYIKYFCLLHADKSKKEIEKLFDNYRWILFSSYWLIKVQKGVYGRICKIPNNYCISHAISERRPIIRIRDIIKSEKKL